VNYAFLVVVSVLVAAMTFVSGFGLGTLLLPAFAIFFPIEIAVAATGVVHFANNLFKAVLVRKWADLKVTLRFAPPAAVGAMAGALALARIGTLPAIAQYQWLGRDYVIDPVKLMIGILIGIFSLWELLPSLERLNVSPKYIPLGGALSGFFGGLSGHQGALRSMFLLRSGLNKEAFIGTSVLSAIVIDLSRLAVYGAVIVSQQAAAVREGADLRLVMASIAAALTGSLLGAKMVKKVTMAIVHRMVGVLLLLIALGLSMGWL
jgi:uncharacterized membrane protein YfcA